MIIEPNSNIRLIISSLELDNLNQLTFNSKQAQENYFKSLPYVEIDDSSYQRKDGYIRFPLPFDEAIKYTYCMYQNEGYSNKWFYAFVKDVQYLNDDVTAMYLETDVYQTWCFDMLWKESFIEREMVAKADDTYHSNTIEENLNFIDYRNLYKTEYDFGTAHPVLATTVSPRDGSNLNGGTYGGIASGARYYIFTGDGLKNGLNTIANAGKSSGIVGLFMAPDWLTGYATATFTDDIAEVTVATSLVEAGGFAIPLNPSVIGSYTPKNKKIFNYPWCYFVLSNNSGNEIVLKLEDFLDSGNHIGSVDIIGSLCPGCSIRAIPVDYEVGDTDFATGRNNEYGINLGKYPICSYPVDMYTNWLTQNAVNIPLSFVSGGIATAAAVATGNPIGAASGIVSIANTIGSIYEHRIIPPSVEGNTNSGDVTYAAGLLKFTGYMKCIKEEKARLLDDFFSMYGYKTNRVKLPNLNNRSNWNYVKTINANITGDIPQNDIQKLKEMFNNGITLWHNPLYFLDYSQTNS